LLIFSIIARSSFAAEAVKKDQLIPYDGILFSQEEASAIKKELIDKDLYRQLNDSYERTLKLVNEKQAIDDKRIEMLTKNNLELYNAISVNKDVQWWEKTLFFVLGVAVAGLGMYVAVKAAPRIN